MAHINRFKQLTDWTRRSNPVGVLLFGLAAAVVIYLYQFKPNKKSNIKELYAEGLDMLVSGKRQAAYKNFKEIVDKDSNNIKGMPGSWKRWYRKWKEAELAYGPSPHFIMDSNSV